MSSTDTEKVDALAEDVKKLDVADSNGSAKADTTPEVAKEDDHVDSTSETKPAVATEAAQEAPLDEHDNKEEVHGDKEDDEDDNEALTTNPTFPGFGGDPNEVITVLHDPMNFNHKHPLFDTWTLWFDNPGKKNNSKDWADNIKEIITFDSVEEFWGLYNNIVKCSNLGVGTNYYLFKSGVRPEWEDPANSKGGRWTCQLPRNNHFNQIDNLWLNTMLAAIGETFDVPDEVTGIALSVRKIFFRIAIWTRTSEDKTKLEKIGKHLREVLKIKSHIAIEFQPHAAAQGAPKEKKFWTV